MRILMLMLLGFFPLLTSANERVLTDYVQQYNNVPGQQMLLQNVRNHKNLWAGWISRVEGRKQSWGTFIALIDDGEITFWNTDEVSSWLGGGLDGAEAGQVADVASSVFVLSSVEGTAELNPLGLPVASILKYATNKWAENQDFNTCRDTKRKAGRIGWALSGWNLASMLNPVLGVIAAVSMYKKGGELTDDTIGRNCQGWIGPIVIDTISVAPQQLLVAKSTQEETDPHMDYLMTASY